MCNFVRGARCATASGLRVRVSEAWQAAPVSGACSGLVSPHLRYLIRVRLSGWLALLGAPISVKERRDFGAPQDFRA
jgi:hypothetical protein